MKFYIETYGCTANFGDSEMMVDELLNHGYEMTNEKDADVIIVNTCGVKLTTERKIIKRLKEISNRKVIVTGCLPLIRRDLVDMFPNFSFLSPDAEYRIVEAMNEKIVDLSTRRIRCKKKSFRFNPIIEIVPISYGCTGFCTYCATKFSRGWIRSCKIEEIVERIKYSVDNGAKEVWITSQDLGAYGVDIGKSLIDLLREILEIDSNFYLRLGMMNVEHVKKFLEELIEIYKDDRVFKFLHVPVQSGSDEVLKDMKRMYSVEDFIKIVREFRKRFPKSTISTDIIVGFPTESEDDFLMTYKLIEKVKPDVVNVSRFSPRPMTIASKLPQIRGSIIKERSRIISSLVRRISLERNREWIGWKGKMIVDEKGKRGMKGRNFAYREIIVDEGKIGDEFEVEIVDAGEAFLKGKIINF